jgi:hypothetical protein
MKLVDIHYFEKKTICELMLYGTPKKEAKEKQSVSIVLVYRLEYI